MKKTAFFVIFVILTALFFGCNSGGDSQSQDTNSVVSSGGSNMSDGVSDSSQSTQSHVSEDGSLPAESSDADTSEESADTSIPSQEQKYPFLDLACRVVAKTVSNDIAYEYTYYLKDDAVVGSKLVTTLQNEEFATLYHQTLIGNYPYALLEGCNVTLFFDEDACVYSGYSLDKLRSALDNGIYTIEVITGNENTESDVPQS